MLKLKLNKNSFVFLLALVLGGLFLFAGNGFAANDLDLKLFSNDLDHLKTYQLVPTDYEGTTRLALVDLGGDGQMEIVISYGNNDWPEVRLYRSEGSLVNKWHPYPEGFKGEISIAVADLDNDGKDEIVTAPAAGGGPQVRIFDGYGNPKFVPAFWAYEESYRQGLELAVNGSEVIVSHVEGNKGIINYFDRYGQKKDKIIEIELADNYEPPKIFSKDMDLDGKEELLVAMGAGNAPKIYIYDENAKLKRDFLVYNENFLGGLNFYSADDKKEQLIITGAGFSGGPHVRFLNQEGRVLKNPAFFAYDKDFRGGVNVAWGDVTGDGKDELVTLPYFYNYNDVSYKYIDIDLSEQKLRHYQNGRKVGEYIISSGKRGMDTPTGEFKIWQKNPRAYSSTYGLYMPYWMSFKPAYGLHELPEWPNGYKEGENHLGIPVSHGCVRLGVGSAERLFNWTPLGTKVIIHQ